MIADLFKQEIQAVNLGTDLFKQNLVEAGVRVVHVDWKPPAGGNREINELLECLLLAGLRSFLSGLLFSLRRPCKPEYSCPASQCLD